MFKFSMIISIIAAIAGVITFILLLCGIIVKPDWLLFLGLFALIWGVITFLYNKELQRMDERLTELEEYLNKK